MADVFNLQASIGLDISDFEKKLAEAAESMSRMSKAFNSAMGNVDSLSRSMSNSSKAVSDASGNISKYQKRLDEARAKVDRLSDAYNRSVKETGADSEETRKLGEELKKAIADMNKAEDDLDKYNKELKETQKESDGAKEKSHKLGDALATVGSAAASAASKVASITATVTKFSAAAIGAGAAAVGKLAKESLASYGQYEQLVGGIETLFGTGGLSVEQYALKVGKSVKDATQEYQKHEAANVAMLENADKAFRTAGLSANQYMETAIQFSASLIQGLGGDTLKASALADTAITDMADNVNKMGTSMEAVQNAYRGLARQNFTMLDNLAIGYQGTAAEMARLINDSGVMGKTFKATADNVKEISFDKYIEAIHVIQQQMGITGTTSKEAANTITGSVASMKSAWANLVTEFAKGDISIGVDRMTEALEKSGVAWDKYKNTAWGAKGASALYADLVHNLENVGSTAEETAEYLSNEYGMSMEDAKKAVEAAQEAISNFKPESKGNLDKYLTFLVDSIETAAGNIIPRLQIILDGIGQLVEKIAPMIAEKLPGLMNTILPSIISAGTKMITTLAKNMPSIIKALVPPVIKGIREVIGAVKSVLPDILAAIREILPELIGALVEAVPLVLQIGGEIMLALVDGIMDNLNEIINAAVKLITALGEGLIANLPMIIQAGIDIILALVDAITKNIEQIVDAAFTIINTLVSALFNGENFKKLLNAGIQLLVSLANAIVDNLPTLIDAVVQIINFVTTELFRSDNLNKLLKAGVDILLKLVEAIIDNIDELFIALENIVSAIWDYFTDPANIKLIIETGVRILVKLVEGLFQIAGKLFGFAVNLDEALDKELSSVNWADLGIAIVDGIISGIVGFDFDSKDFFGNFGEYFKSGIKDIFGIHSPSKVMRDEVGKFLALGIGEGFVDGADAATAEAVNSAMGIVDSIQNALDRNSPAIDDKIEEAMETAKALADPLVIDVKFDTGALDEMLRSVEMSKVGISTSVMQGMGEQSAHNVSFAGAEIIINVNGADRNGAEIADEIAERLAFMDNLENLKAGVVAL